ncbi:MAG: TonB-dependent receptor, partial [Bacteroidales bacterium]|nr:TonB-dependent receptor [Bacteroidales bacterium]
SDRWQLDANWIFASGTRFSEPGGFYYYNSYLIPVYTEKNNAKLPDYHRLDVAVSFRLNKNSQTKYSHQLSFTLINLYGRKNPIAVNFNKIQNGNETYAVPANYITENQILPTKMYLFGTVPLISYKFNFQNKK